MKILIWVAERPTTAGSINLKIRSSPGSRRLRANLSLNPTRHNSGTWNSSCSEPPTRVPQAMPTMGAIPNLGAASARLTPATTEPKLKKLEATEGTKNFPLVLRTPMARAARETRMRKGNMILVIKVVSSSFPGTVPKSGAMTPTISGESQMPAMTTRLRSRVKQKTTLLASRQVFSGPRRCS